MTDVIHHAPPEGFVDIIPAEVLMPDGYTIIRRARVVAHEGRIIVWAENPSEPSDIRVAHDAPVLAVRQWPDLYLPRRQQTLVVETTQGRITVNAMPGCGCGNSGLSHIDAAAHYPPRPRKR